MTPVPIQLGLTAPPPGVPSCATCPSAMSDLQLRSATGKGFGGAGCAKKMLPLNLPIAPQKVRDRTAQHIAKNCDEYGKPSEGIDPLASEAAIEWGPVFLPAPNPKVGPPPLGGRVTTCQGCAHFVGASEVADATDWQSGACLAKGKLLLIDRLSKYARGCDKSAPLDRSNPGSLDLVKMWFPEYTRRFGEKDKEKMAAKQRSTDPLHWPTDREVTGADKELGIRAWRKLEDPEGFGQPVYFPVMDPSAFTPEELTLIPRTGDREHPEIYHDHSGAVYELAVNWMCLNQTTAVWGPPGAGKTELGRHMAWLGATPYHRIQITDTSEVDDLVGTTQYSKERGTHFIYGRLPEFWQRPGVIGLDEPNLGPPAVWQAVRPLTDNSQEMVLDMAPGHPKIPRHKLCFFAMFLNPAWGLLNVGTQTIGDADQRRLLHMWMDLPPEDVEKQIITDHCMVLDQWNPKAHLDSTMKIAQDIRLMVDEGRLPVTWGVASTIKVTRLLRYYPPMKAYKMAVLNYLDPVVAQPVVDAIMSYYPS